MAGNQPTHPERTAGIQIRAEAAPAVANLIDLYCHPDHHVAVRTAISR